MYTTVHVYLVQRNYNFLKAILSEIDVERNRHSQRSIRNDDVCLKKFEVTRGEQLNIYIYIRASDCLNRIIVSFEFEGVLIRYLQRVM